MITSYVPERFTALFGNTFSVADSVDVNKTFILENDDSYRPIDGNDPRNFLLNTLENSFKNLQNFNPRLAGLVIAKTYATFQGNARLTYSVQFTFKDTRANILVDDQPLENIIPF